MAGLWDWLISENSHSIVTEQQLPIFYLPDGRQLKKDILRVGEEGKRQVFLGVYF